MLIPYLQNAGVGLCSKFKLLIKCVCVYLYAHTHHTQQYLVSQRKNETDRAKEREPRIFVILLVASARLDLLTSVW